MNVFCGMLGGGEWQENTGLGYVFCWKKQLCLINWNLWFLLVLNRLLKYGREFKEWLLLLFKQNV